MKYLKHTLLLFCVLVFTMQQAKADGSFTYGEAVDFKSGKVFMNFAVYDDNSEKSAPKYLFTVTLKSSKKHLSYSKNSKLVIKFANDSVIEVKSFGDEIHEFEPTYGVEYADDGIEYTGRNQNPYYRPWISDNRPPMNLLYRKVLSA